MALASSRPPSSPRAPRLFGLASPGFAGEDEAALKEWRRGVVGDYLKGLIYIQAACSEAIYHLAQDANIESISVRSTRVTHDNDH